MSQWSRSSGERRKELLPRYLLDGDHALGKGEVNGVEVVVGDEGGDDATVESS